MCIRQNLDFFVDMEKGIVNFDCPEFREILEYARTYPATISGISEEAGLVSTDILDSVLDVQSVPHMIFDGQGQFIGYPTMDGSPRTILMADSDAVALSIYARSDKKAGAWDFIEYALNYDFSELDGRMISTYGGIPSNEELLSKLWKELTDTNINANINHIRIGNPKGDYYLTHAFTPEEVDEFYRLLDCVTVGNSRMNQIYEIVIEEVQPYFLNQKTMDQVIEIIEGRV